MEFDCKLAHSNRIEKISAFNSIRELYIKIGQAFSISSSDILFCTLNSHDFSDMDNILGNHLSLSDLIIAHVCGERRELEIVKDKEFLGLTITDNGDGRAFVKKIKPGSSIEQLIKPGDHIEMINNRSMVGLRHHEVAMALKDIAIDSVLIIKLIEPLIPAYDIVSFYKIMSSSNNNHNQNRNVLHDINQAININSSSTSSTPTPSSILSATTSSSSFEDLAKSSLPIDRLLSTNRSNFSTNNHKGLVSQSDHHYLLENHYKIIIDRIESQLESFLGIKDTELALQIYRLLEDKRNENVKDFIDSIKKSDLKIFDFGKDFIIDLWDIVTEYKRNEDIKNENSSSELI